MGENFIGIEIGGTKLQIVRGDGSAKIVDRIRYNIVKEHGAEGIKNQIEEALDVFCDNSKPLAVGIGFGGPVDRGTGKISLSFHIQGWKNFGLVQWLASKVNAPVFLENDGNVAALGEATYGAGKHYQHVFYVTLGSGVGGGMVQEGKIYHGALPGESEIGHIRLDRDSRTMENCCSGWSVDRKVRDAINKEPASILARLSEGENSGEAKLILPAIEKGDLLAKQILQETGEDIAFGLSHVVHLFHPEIIVLGGGLSLIGEPLRTIVENELPKHIMEAFLPGPVISLSQLKEDAVPVGALELARRQYLTLKQ